MAQSVTKGLRNQEQFFDKIHQQNNDEIGGLAQSFKILMAKLKSTIQQSQEKNQKLEELAQQEALRKWHTEGLTLFNEIMRNQHEGIEKLSFEFISELVKYTKSNQGGLFVVDREDEDDMFLELRGCYAYERRKYQKKRIDWDEGLIGTVWQQGKTLMLTDIPQDYVHIRSGLGKANPSCLLIVPVKSNEDVEGVIELISFYQYRKHEVEFIEALAQRVGNTLVSLKANEKTRKLLAVTEKIAQEAQVKESKLQEQLKNYQYWVQQFESKLNDISEEALIYQAIVGRAYTGIIITNEKFQITKVNNYIAKRFDYKRKNC
ncbi:MAG: GAF domain-containing protein [Bacteroidia bacterium]|nr:GAF domain-containing protein [Bacteroidia bacterium]